MDIIKQVNQNYVTPYLYDCINAMNRINNDLHLSLTTGATVVALSAKSQF